MAEYHIDKGIHLLEKYKGEFVQILLVGNKPIGAELTGRLMLGNSRGYLVRNEYGTIYFSFFDVKWLQESSYSEFYYLEDGERKRYKGKSLLIFVSYRIEDDVKLYQDVEREIK